MAPTGIPAFDPVATIIVVASSEMVTGEPAGGVASRLGLAPEDTVLVVVPGARVLRADGEVARAICLAAAWEAPTEIVVVCEEDSPFRSPTFGVPGQPPPGESFPTVRDLVRHSVAQLRASPWLPRGTRVHGLVVTSSGTIESAVATDVGAAPLMPASAGIAAAGPVSFFGAGPVQSLMSPPEPLETSPAWDPPPPMVMPAQMVSSPTSLYAVPGQEITVGAPAPVAAPMPRVQYELPPPPEPISIRFESEPRTPPPPPPPPRQQPRQQPQQRPQAKPPEPPPLPQSGEDPFERAEKILERLRKERRNR